MLIENPREGETLVSYLSRLGFEDIYWHANHQRLGCETSTHAWIQNAVVSIT